MQQLISMILAGVWIYFLICFGYRKTDVYDRTEEPLFLDGVYEKL